MTAIPDEAVEAAYDVSTHLDITTSDIERILEAATPHLIARAADVAAANNDHIVPGGDGYSAGFHYALQCLALNDEDPRG
jgi:hypothetical protein